MKKFIPFLILIFLFSCQDPTADPGTFKFTWHTAVAVLVALYEAIVRVIPVLAQYSIIGKIISILQWISEFLQRKKK